MIGLKFRQSEKVGMIEWSEHCKIFIFHREALSERWVKKLKCEPIRPYFFESNMMWLCIFKRYKVDTVKRLVPEILPNKDYSMNNALDSREMSQEFSNPYEQLLGRQDFPG